MNTGRIYVFMLLILTVLASFNPAQASDSEKRDRQAQEIFGKLNISRFEEMFQTGKFDFRFFGHYNVVHYAAFMGDLDRVKQLAEYADSVKYSISYSLNMLHFAAQSGNLELVQWLVEQGLDVSSEYVDSDSTLYYAMESGNFEMVQWLMEHGAKLCYDEADNESDESESSKKRKIDRRYKNAAARSGNLKLIQWLLEQGVDFDDINVSDAAQSGSLELVQWLYSKGANIRFKLNDGASSGNMELVQWMYSHGAVMNYDDGEFANALEAAASSGNLELVQWLANEGVGVTYQSLCNAADSGNLELVRWLVEQGVDIRVSKTKFTLLAMGCAVYSGNLNIVRYFVEEKGIDVNDTVADRRFGYLSALELAADHNDFDMVQYLVDHGARVNPGFRIKPYWFELSQIGGDPEIVEYLKQRDHSLVYWGFAISLIVLAIGSYFIYRIVRPKQLVELD